MFPQKQIDGFEKYWQRRKPGTSTAVHYTSDVRIFFNWATGRSPEAITVHDVDQMTTPPAEETLGPTLEAIRLVVEELAPRGIPLIGFAGAPFTLASYAIEGGSSKNFAKTKTLMYAQPAAWDRLMDKLVKVQADYLIQQAKAGAQALQIFDSWVGLALSKADYLEFVKPYNTELFDYFPKPMYR